MRALNQKASNWTSSRVESRSASDPAPSRGSLISDIRHFLLERPAVPTLRSDSEREDYTQRIRQRLGISVEPYAILNIHQIGINAPAMLVFDEVLHWDTNIACWPNRLAEIKLENGRLEHIKVYLLGIKKQVFGMSKLFGFQFVPLFRLDALKFQREPHLQEVDNARYLLYKCSGGYPMGVFCVYVRSSIADQGEVEPTQLFYVVGFNFYGRDDWHKSHPIAKLWEKVHNRVTSNVMNRLKQACETRFVELQRGP